MAGGLAGVAVGKAAGAGMSLAGKELPGCGTCSPLAITLTTIAMVALVVLIVPLRMPLMKLLAGVLIEQPLVAVRPPLVVLPIKPRTVKTVSMVESGSGANGQNGGTATDATENGNVDPNQPNGVDQSNDSGHLAMVVMALPALTAKMLIIQTLIVTRATVLTINLMINRLVMILVPMTATSYDGGDYDETILMGLKTPPDPDNDQGVTQPDTDTGT